ncbi:hypothetical protein DM01DRAFT_328369 [Hesseltinella vesiculosa]|uniref:F-box domain-containing protein n=1 Tax=Hesseltinella vesiculosa TaxID=101127 RepID=A0A1X2G9H2_9FUNG|nr:hypothetical protein DM01DRAFT_328369 [Hesseltinella vesiculosa]
MLHSFPAELFRLIEYRLDTNDRYQCLFVSREWYSLWFVTLYRKCAPASRYKYVLFSQTLQGMSLELRRNIRDLDVTKCELIMEEQKHLFNMCPRLQNIQCQFFPAPSASTCHSMFSRYTTSELPTTSFDHWGLATTAPNVPKRAGT